MIHNNFFLEKICTICRVSKPKDQFRARSYISKKGLKTTLEGRCKECERVRSKKYSADPKNKEKSRLRSLRSYHKIGAETVKENRKRNIKKHLLNGIKYRAKIKGLEFNLKEEDLIIPDICPLLNIPIIIGNSSKENYSSPSVDRIDNSKGYIKSNIRIISNRANKLKNDLTKEEAEIFFKNLQNYWNY